MKLSKIIAHYLTPVSFPKAAEKDCKVVSDTNYFESESYFKELNEDSLSSLRNLVTRINNSDDYEEVKVVTLENCFMFIFQCKGYPFFFKTEKEELG